MRRVRAWLVVVGVAVAGLLGSSWSGAAAAVPDQWAATYGSAANTGTNAGERAVTAATAKRLQPSWRVTGGARSVSPVIVGNVVYQAVNGYAGDDPSYLEARDVRTGKRLWRLRLPHGLGDAYLNGPSVSGTVLVLPYAGGNHRRSGLTAVDIRTRKVLWTRSRSPFDAQDTSGTGGPAVVDGGRIHLLAGLDLSSYDLRTGRALWRKKAPGRGFGAIAAAGGKLYASSVGAAGAETARTTRVPEVPAT
jgi:outer membrane protein assembly factor BamB